jgi:hypothetical protein
MPLRGEPGPAPNHQPGCRVGDSFAAVKRLFEFLFDPLPPRFSRGLKLREKGLGWRWFLRAKSNREFL